MIQLTAPPVRQERAGHDPDAAWTRRIGTDREHFGNKVHLAIVQARDWCGK